MPERFKVVLDHARRYTSARLYLYLTFTAVADSGLMVNQPGINRLVQADITTGTGVSITGTPGGASP